MMVSHCGAKPACQLSVVRRSANSLSMNLRHAAALASVGWYLMMPLVQNKKPVEICPPDSIGAKTSASGCGQLHYIYNEARVDPKAPLSKWSMACYSNSMRDCQAFLDKFKKAKSDRNLETGRSQKTVGDVMDQTFGTNAQCVAGDDPRLKGNEQIREFQQLGARTKSGALDFGCLEQARRAARRRWK
jgi:hypothetical protein